MGAWNEGSVFPLLIVYDITGAFTGLFVYSGVPGAGDLIASVTAAAGTDPYGNAYQAGITSYLSSVPADFVQLFSSTVNFMNAGDTAQAQISGGSGGMSFTSGESSTVGLATATLQLLQSLTAANAPRAILSSDSSVALLLSFAQGAADPTTANIVGPSLTWLPNTHYISQVDKSAAAYVLGHNTSYNTSDQLINSTSFSAVCSSGITVLSGSAYRVRAVLTCQQGPNAANNDYRLGFTGTISQVRMKAEFAQQGGTVGLATTTSNNGLLASSAFAPSTIYEANFDGIIVTTSTGTLSLQAAMDAATDTFTVLALSFFHVEPVS